MVASVTKSQCFAVRIINFIYHSLYERGESFTFALFELPPREIELSVRLLQVLFQSGDLGRMDCSGKQHILLIYIQTY